MARRQVNAAPADKAALRRDLRARRIALPAAQRRRHAAAAARHALRALLAHGVRRVALYLAHGSELDTAPLLHDLLDAGVRVALPQIRGRTLRFVELRRGVVLRRGAHGILAPAHGVQLPVARLDAVVLPLLGFDAHGTRLGSGAGYYDRALAHARGRRPLRLGYAHALQECAALPREPWDVPLHAVATERGLRRLQGCARLRADCMSVNAAP